MPIKEYILYLSNYMFIILLIIKIIIIQLFYPKLINLHYSIRFVIKF